MPTTYDRYDSSINVEFDNSLYDNSFTSSLESWNVSYSLYLPLVVSPHSSSPRLSTPASESTGSTRRSNQKPLLVLCHPFNNSRQYWDYQVNDQLLEAYPKLVIDGIGFSNSKTNGRRWTFDLAAYSILTLLEKINHEKKNPRKAMGKEDVDAPVDGWPIDGNVIVVGDSMGGGPTGLRVALRDVERRNLNAKVDQNEQTPKVSGSKGDKDAMKIVGVVACGTSAEEEGTEFVKMYTEAADQFSADCHSKGVELAISNFANQMALDGSTDRPEFEDVRKHLSKVIGDSLTKTFSKRDEFEQGLENEVDPGYAGEVMKTNYRCLNERRGLVEELKARPSPLGGIKVLVVHGTDDGAYPFEDKYHQRTVEAIGLHNAETYVVQGGSHFVTATHWDEVDRVLVDWISRNRLLND